MKVHMVTHWMGYRGPKQPWPRIVRYLRDHLGWSASYKLDPGADVNYILTYSVGMRRYDHPWDVWRGPTACRFEERPAYGLKARLWDEGINTASLRLSEARRHTEWLQQFGPAARVRFFPVERDLFMPVDRPKHEKPTIGVVGYCSGMTGRKGQVLVNQLAHYPGAQHWRVKAAGMGWPVKTTEYHYRDLPRFYQSLDVHLCPTLSRDSPTSPYEALACGVPLVIPRGVPLLDELPFTLGVYRYEQGDFDDMFRMLAQCIDELGTYDRQALRDLTVDMTPHNLCFDHERIFAAHFGGLTCTTI